MEEIKNVLTGIMNKFEIINFEGQSPFNFKCQVNCMFSVENSNYDDRCQYFINKFSENTATNWITKKRFSKPIRYDFRKLFVCQLSEKNKTKNKKKGINRNFNCKASISIKFLKATKSILNKQMNARININHDHSHRIDVAQSFRLLRCSEDTKQIFYSYFESGMTAAAAKLYHEMSIMENCDKDAYISLANAQKNPLDRQVTHMYEQWRLQAHSKDIGDSTNVLNQKKIDLSRLNVDLCIKEDPITCVIITPIMRRVFLEGLADEIVFIDTGSINRTYVTFIFAGTKIGVLPVAVILHTSQSEENYTHAFHTAKNFIEESCNKLFQPAVVMTDDNSAEINALKNTLPNSRMLLCIFHVNQSLWRWLWQSDHGVSKEDRKPIMKQFRSVMFAKTIREAEINMTNLCQDDRVKENKKIENHLSNMWTRRDEWCISYRSDFLTRGNNTNNYCEVSIKVFKDVVLQRCKVFNMCALIDFIAKTFETYHKKRLMEFGNERSHRLAIQYQKFCQKSKKIKDIIKVDNDTYCVKDGHDQFMVDFELYTCDCLYGAGGKFCKHLCAVEKKFGTIFSTSLFLTESDCQKFVMIALSEKFSPQLFKNIYDADTIPMDTSIKDEISNSFNINQTEIATTIYTVNTFDENYKGAIEKIKTQLLRIANIMENDANPANISTLEKFASSLSELQTPSNIISFICNINAQSRKIQPTLLARHEDKDLPCGGRIQSDRPAKNRTCHRDKVYTEEALSEADLTFINNATQEAISIKPDPDNEELDLNNEVCIDTNELQNLNTVCTVDTWTSLTDDTCCIDGCLSTVQNCQGNTLMYSFPHDVPQKLKAWISAVRRLNSDETWECKPFSKICSKHFVYRKKQTLSYVPTIKTMPDDTQINDELENDTNEQSYSFKDDPMCNQWQSRSTDLCCIYGCSSTIKNRKRNLIMYIFPINQPEKLEAWVSAVRELNSDETWECMPSSKICSKHFVGGKGSHVKNSPSYLPTIKLIPEYTQINNEFETNTTDHSYSFKDDPICNQWESRSIDLCCIYGCSTSIRNCRKQNVKMYLFPSKLDAAEKLQAWINAVRDLNDDATWECKTLSKVCSKHFVDGHASYDIKSVSYIPTIPAPTPATTPATTPAIKNLPVRINTDSIFKKDLMCSRNSKSDMCCINGCSTTIQNCQKKRVRMYLLPTKLNEPQRYEAWLSAIRKLNSDKTWEVSAHSKICSNHFVGGKTSRIRSSVAYVPTIKSPGDIQFKSEFENNPKYDKIVQNKSSNIFKDDPLCVNEEDIRDINFSDTETPQEELMEH